MILSGVILKELKLEAELIKFINHEKAFRDLGSGFNVSIFAIKFWFDWHR